MYWIGKNIFLRGLLLRKDNEMNKNFEISNDSIEWGNSSLERLLRKLYCDKDLKNMSDEEVWKI